MRYREGRHSTIMDESINAAEEKLERLRAEQVSQARAAMRNGILLSCLTLCLMAAMVGTVVMG